MCSAHSSQNYSWEHLLALARRQHFIGVAMISLTVMAVLLVRAVRRRNVDLISFTFFFALVGSTDLLVTKLALHLLEVCAESREADLPPGSTVVAAVLLMLLLHLSVFGFQVVSTSYSQALVSIPLFLGTGAMLQVIIPGTYFNEFDSFHSLRLAVFVSGFMAMIAGMLVTSWGHAHAEQLEKELEVESPSKLHIRPVVSSGLLSRSCVSLSSSQLLLMPDLQRSVMVFGGAYPLPPAFSVSLSRSGQAWSMPEMQKLALLHSDTPANSSLPGLADPSFPVMSRAGSLPTALSMKEKVNLAAEYL
eukprot:CAMPEP_0170587762 /NCGR_PEP_ID=MMETSP0224-20130122/10458_1 /TAXON_ID=285029 /ORGANISM="Togula jolla, Strain CCCM 725" /LENGTH=304 /DNA_ID=CAMNT_0010911411 /DNA_START=295 /DNA_END=1206 /DNA_ORIENTATION=+